ncbi:MAG TPA: hypothetical protein VEX37_13305 [Thermomicrobiales bacterium]|nr:hypothetical protein [Thermomicrobiales bacterium]
MRWLLIAAIALTVACGEDEGATTSDATPETIGQVEEVATRGLTAAISGDWGAVYDDLHPAQQAVVNRDLFVECRSQVAAPPYSILVTQTGHDTMTAPEIYDRSSWAVLFDLQLEGYETISSRMHIYDTDGQLSWYMGQVSMDAFRAGRCDIEPKLASNFALTIANAEIAGDWATAYDGLHPNQQAVVPRDLFLECRATDSVRPTQVSESGVVMETFGTAEVPETESYAVTLRGVLADQSTIYETFHIFDVGEGFGWVLGELSVAAFQAGRCD